MGTGEGENRMKAATAIAGRPAIPELLSLTKPRITIMVLATTLVGFYLATRESVSAWLLFHTLFGTALVASGASALNMVFEWETDSKMRRTETRPIPSGRLSIFHGLLFGSFLCLSGIL